MGSHQVRRWSIDRWMGRHWEGMLRCCLWASWAFFARLSRACTGLENAWTTAMGGPKAHPAAPMFVDWQRTIGMCCHGLAMVLAGMFKRANGLLKRGRCPRHARKLCGTTLGMLTLAHRDVYATSRGWRCHGLVGHSLMLLGHVCMLLLPDNGIVSLLDVAQHIVPISCFVGKMSNHVRWTFVPIGALFCLFSM